MISVLSPAWDGCRRPPAPPVAPLDAGLEVGIAPTVGPGLVEAYLRYQRALFAAASRNRPGRGASGWESLQREAQAEEKALRAAGLSEEELEAVEPLVLSMLGRLRVAKATGLEETRAAYERMKAKVPPQNQAEIDAVLADLKAREKELTSFEQERTRYGSAAVDAVLEHASELLSGQDAWLATQVGVSP